MTASGAPTLTVLLELVKGEDTTIVDGFLETIFPFPLEF